MAKISPYLTAEEAAARSSLTVEEINSAYEDGFFDNVVKRPNGQFLYDRSELKKLAEELDEQDESEDIDHEDDEFDI